MAKIIAFGEYQNKIKQRRFEENLQSEIEKVEEKLGIEEPLLVLTDDIALTLGNYLLDIKESVTTALEILGIEESEELPEGLE